MAFLALALLSLWKGQLCSPHGTIEIRRVHHLTSSPLTGFPFPFARPTFVFNPDFNSMETFPWHPGGTHWLLSISFIFGVWGSFEGRM